MTKSLTTKLYLKKRLYTLRMKEGTCLQDHINEFNQIVMDIKNIGIKLEEEDQALLLICSLPTSYENLCNSMLYGRDTIKLEDVKASVVKCAHMRAHMRDATRCAPEAHRFGDAMRLQ